VPRWLEDRRPISLRHFDQGGGNLLNDFLKPAVIRFLGSGDTTVNGGARPGFCLIHRPARKRLDVNKENSSAA